MSLAVFPAPPSIDVTALVTLSLVPAIAPVTVTLKVQLLSAASAAPANDIVLGEVVVNVPPHSEVEDEATVTPSGKLSAKPIPERELD